MAVLSGWKEIADYLHLGVRTAQRWERLGLPVSRVSSSRCSPVVAASDELESWLKGMKRRMVTRESFFQRLEKFRSTRRKARKLVKQLRGLRREHRRLLEQVRARVSDTSGREDLPSKGDQAIIQHLSQLGPLALDD